MSTRLKDWAKTTESPTSPTDAWIAVDGSTDGSTKMLYSSLVTDISAKQVASPGTYDLATLHTDGKLLASQVRYAGLVFLGVSTVAALPNPAGLAAGSFYLVSDTGGIWSQTWTAINQAAISDGTVYSVGPNATQQVAEGGTGATTAAAARTNLDVMLTADVTDRQLSKAPSNGLYFDGVNDKVSLGAASALLAHGDGTDDSPLLFAANVQPDDVTNFPIYAKNLNGGSNSEFYFIFNAADKLALHLHDESANVWVTRIQNAASVVDGQSVHVAAAYDGRGGANAADGITLYIDGVVVPSTAASGGAYDSMEDTAANAEVGKNESGGTFAEGVIRSLLVFNREPTAAEILRLSINGNVPEISDQWGKADGGTYTSDFTVDSIDGFGFDGSNSPTADVTDTLGSDADHVKLVAGSGTGTARMWKSVGVTTGKRYRVSFDYYMPAGQGYVDGFKTGANVNLTAGNYTDVSSLETNGWTPFTIDLPTPIDPSNDSFFIILKDGTSTTIDPSAVGEYIAFRDIKVTEIGAVLSLNPDNIESDGDWLDATSNELNGTATGAAPLMVQPQTSGTFTPVLQFDGVSGSTYAATGQLGYWRMIDEKTVSLEIYIQITAVGTEEGAATIGGLPFLSRAASEWTAQALIGGAGLTSLTGALHGLVRGYNTTIILSQTSATGDAGVTHANFTATSYLQISAVYAIV